MTVIFQERNWQLQPSYVCWSHFNIGTFLVSLHQKTHNLKKFYIFFISYLVPPNWRFVPVKTGVGLLRLKCLHCRLCAVSHCDSSVSVVNTYHAASDQSHQASTGHQQQTQQNTGFSRSNQPFYNNRGMARGGQRGGRGMINGYRGPSNGFRGMS